MIPICGLIILSHIEKDITKNATKRDKILKKEFNLHTVITYSLLYHQNFKCNIVNYKNIQEYRETVTKVRNKLVELGNILLELAVTYIFLDELNISYQVWKNIYFGGYNKDGVDRDRKMIVSTIEKIFKLCIDKESGAKVSALYHFTIQAFNTFQKAKKPKEKYSFFK